jgi:hypothetical protein
MAQQRFDVFVDYVSAQWHALSQGEQVAVVLGVILWVGFALWLRQEAGKP